MTKHEFGLIGAEVVDFLEACNCDTHAKLHISANLSCYVAVSSGMERYKFLELMGKLYDHAELESYLQDGGEIHG